MKRRDDQDADFGDSELTGAEEAGESVLVEGDPGLSAAELDASEAELGPVLSALSLLHNPPELDPEVHEAMLITLLGASAARESAEPAASSQEISRAEELRLGLAAADQQHPLVRVAGALRAAAAPKHLSEIRYEAIRAQVVGRSRGPRRTLVATAVAGALAAAAAFMFYAGGGPSAPPPLPHSVRSTSELFELSDFAEQGGERDRIDRIARARRSELRDNRFAAWGVR